MSLFDDDVQFNEHQVAWYSKDWNKVQEMADTFKQKAENEFFEIIGAINEKKQCSIAQKEYNKFMVENALSQHPECMTAVYTMNLIGSELSDEAHFNYMVAAVPQGRRFGKWAKLIEDTQEILILRVLMKYYTINLNDAQVYRETLERKGKLGIVLKEAKGLVTDEFLKDVTKNVKEQKQFKKQALEW
ncbi:clamp loader subunit [Salmonella phage STP4-a]|uniref:Sliding-clamp-loader small subunit n=1 Tax=Salmonella phage STP4-a TaxID=1445860 RepID=A0A0B4L988_9CAUD|nr:clamp loader subunit [Salmonella phage STP4-a]AHJ86897.1 clamp loader subunit [Salmonella phage STP4-a]UFK27170.1 hypothetical protein LG358_00149 [Escherichia phage UoN_LG358_1]